MNSKDKKDAAFLLREEEAAQRKRLQAQSFLKKNGCGPSQHQQQIAKVGLVAALSQKKHCKSSTRDNTLSILQKRKLEDTSVNAGSNNKSNSNDSTVNSTARDGGEVKTSISADMPLEWKAISDPKSGKMYYWNKITNETTWECPSPSPSPCNNDEVEKVIELPTGWKEIIHPATKQKYYVHTSGKKSWSFPTPE